MVGMFGGQRSFGSRLQPTISDQLGAGLSVNRTAFGQPGGAAMPMMGQAQMANSQNLDMLGARQFQGGQAEADRDLERLLQMRDLANKMQLAGVDQQTQFGVQDRRNTGALDQINASGGWERSITGDKLSSNERLAGLQRELEMGLAQGGWAQQGADRNSREKLGFAELDNALRRQELVGRQGLDQIGAQGNVSAMLQGMEGGQRINELNLTGQNALNQIDAQGGVNTRLQQLQNAGQFNIANLGEQGSNFRAGLGERGATDRAMIGADTAKTVSQAEIQAALQRSRDQNAMTKYGIDTDRDMQFQQFGQQERLMEKQQGFQREESSADRAFRGQQTEADRSFRGSEGAAEREHEATLRTADRIAQHGPPEHAEKIRGYVVAEGAAQARIAEAQAKAAEARMLMETNPQRGEAMLLQAQAEARAADAAAKMAEAKLANTGLDAELIRTQIDREKAETRNLEYPGGETAREVDALINITRNNPGVAVGNESIRIDPAMVGRSSTTMNPLVESQVLETLPTLGGNVDYKLSKLRNQFPNVPEEMLRSLIKRGQEVAAPSRQMPAGMFGGGMFPGGY